VRERGEGGERDSKATREEGRDRKCKAEEDRVLPTKRKMFSSARVVYTLIEQSERESGIERRTECGRGGEGPTAPQGKIVREREGDRH
jgi:hypothetical protein